MKVKVSEIFDSIQGEGPYIGHPATFIRLYGCNMSCPWCDSGYAKTGKFKEVEVENIIERIKNKRIAVFTGGEPLLQYKALRKIWSTGTSLHLETNGSVSFGKYLGFDYASVSPKLHALNEEYLDTLTEWARAAVYMPQYEISFKFVYESDDSWKAKLNSVLLNFKENDVNLKGLNIYMMPEGQEFNRERYKECAEFCIDNGYILAPRLHTLIWPKQRGV
jgi:7-carboxy-7-deazaguanine synthase